MKRRLLALGLALSCLLCGCGQSASEPAVLTRDALHETLTGVMESRDAVAVSVAVIDNGEITASDAWGWAVKGEREMTAHSNSGNL